MGSQLSLVAHTAPSIAISSYIDVLDEVHYLSQLNSSRFLKTCKALDPNGEILIKVFIKPTDEYGLKDLNKRLTAESQILAQLPNVLNYSKIVESDRAGYLIRQHLKFSTYDRLSSRPFFEDVELKFIVFQLLQALNDIHSKGVRHGDLKLENLMLNSWNWLVITDFAAFLKPTYLPEDNPGEFSFYFDTSQRRNCYVAPERFDSEKYGSHTEQSLTCEMDIFSAGCCIAEIFSEGYSMFNLSELFRYKNGDYDPAVFLDKHLKDPLLKEMIKDMIQLEPLKRISIRQILEKYRGSIFPDHFYTFHYEYFKDLALCSGGLPGIGKIHSNSKLSGQVFEMDKLVEKIYKDLPRICAALNYPVTPASALNENTSSTTGLEITIASLGTVKLRHYSANLPSAADESSLLLLSVLLHALRTTSSTSTKRRCLEVIITFSQYISDSNKLDRVVPYLVSMFFDECSGIQALSVEVSSQILKLVTQVNRINENIFTDYLIPRLKRLLLNSKHNEYVRIALAGTLGTFARSAIRFQDATYLSHIEEELDRETISLLHKMKRRLVSGFEEIMIAFLTDNEASVKMALLSNILPLCDLLGREKTNDIILSHLITYLNDKNSSLRIQLIEAITGIAILLGPITLEQYILPLLIQTTSDSEELVVVTVLKSLKTLCRVGLIQKTYYFDIAKLVSALLLHPNFWIRQLSLLLLVEISNKLSRAEVYCLLYPIIRPYFEFDVQLTWSSMISSCKKPVSRTVYNLLCTWSLRASNSLFWKQVPSKHKDSFGNNSAVFINREYSAKNYGLGGSYKLSKASLKLADNTEILLTNEDKGWLDKIKTVGLKENELWKLAALRAYIFRVAKMIARRPDAVIPNNPLLGNGLQSKKGFSVNRLPRTVFFDVQFLTNDSQIGDSTHIILKNQGDTEQTVTSNTNKVLQLRSFDLNKSLILNAKAAPTLNSNLDNVFVQLETSKVKGHAQALGANEDNSEPSRYIVKNSYEGVDRNIEAFLQSIKVIPPLKAYPEFGPFSGLRTDAYRDSPNQTFKDLSFAFQVSEHKAASINILSSSPNYPYALSGSDDGSVRLWDLPKILNGQTFSSRVSFDAGSSVSDIKLLSGFDAFVIATKEGPILTLKVLQTEEDQGEPSTSLRMVRKFHPGQSSEYAIKLNVVSIDNEPMIISLMNTSRFLVIDPRLMKVTKVIKSDPRHGCVLCFTVKNDTLISGTSTGIIDVWDLRFEVLVSTWAFGNRSPITALANYPSMSKHEERNILVVGGSPACFFTIWDYTKRQCRHVAVNGEIVPPVGTFAATTLNPNKDRIAPRPKMIGTISAVEVVDHKVLISDSKSNGIFCFDPKERIGVVVVSGVTSELFSFTTTQLTASTTVCVKNTVTGQRPSEAASTHHHNTINSMTVVHDGNKRFLVSADRAGVLNIYQ